MNSSVILPVLRILSRRENEILQMVALGFTSEEIARQLFLSKRTVENHRANMRRKLAAQNTAGMLHRAMQAGGK